MIRALLATAVGALAVPAAASGAPLVIADNSGGDRLEASVSDGQDHQITDLVLARDGERDQVIRCGAGADRAVTDPIDVAPQSC